MDCVDVTQASLVARGDDDPTLLPPQSLLVLWSRTR
jgi:hypothetical protein